MGLTTRRDPEVIGPAFARWFAEDRRADHAEVTNLVHPSAGYSSETMLVDVRWSSDGRTQDERLVIRIEPASAGTFDEFDLVAEHEAQSAAAAVGVPVAGSMVETDPSWLGSPFMVMDRVDGHIVGELPLHDPWLRSLDEPARSDVHRTFIETLAAIHRADPSGAERLPRRDNAGELDHWERYLAWSSGGDPVPTLVDALAWCREHRPAAESDPVLCWGDVRFENMVLADDGSPRAVLDWDMAFVGAPEHDIAWYTALDLTAVSLLGKRLRGFPDREATIDTYERASGRRVRDIDWYETLALLRSTAIMTRIGYLRRDAGEPVLLPIEDNPLLDLLRGRVGRI